MAEDNPNYAEFAEMLGSIDRKGKSVDLPNPLPLQKFLGTNLEGYYTYKGSLTTPPCAEEVVWVDFSEPIAISEYQVGLHTYIYFSIFYLYIYPLTAEPLSSAHRQRWSFEEQFPTHPTAQWSHRLPQSALRRRSIHALELDTFRGCGQCGWLPAVQCSRCNFCWHRLPVVWLVKDSVLVAFN